MKETHTYVCYVTDFESHGLLQRFEVPTDVTNMKTLRNKICGNTFIEIQRIKWKEKVTDFSILKIKFIIETTNEFFYIDI